MQDKIRIGWKAREHSVKWGSGIVEVEYKDTETDRAEYRQ